MRFWGVFVTFCFAENSCGGILRHGLRHCVRIWDTKRMSFESPESDVGRSGKSHPTWEGSAIQPEAQAGCQGLNISKLSVLNGSSGSSSLRADLKFLRLRHLARFCPLVPFPCFLYAGLAPFFISSWIPWFFLHFLLLSLGFLVPMNLSPSPLLDLPF